jgi:hypothetical protein
MIDYEVAAAFLGGTSSGALLSAVAAWIASGFFAPLSPSARMTLLCSAALLVWLIKEGPLARTLSLPENRRQIPAEVLAGGSPRGAMRFGFELGTGMRTYVPSPAPYLALLLVLLGHLTLGTAIVIALGFGVGRALPLMVQIGARDRDTLTRRFLQNRGRFGSAVASLVIVIGGFVLVA